MTTHRQGGAQPYLVCGALQTSAGTLLTQIGTARVAAIFVYEIGDISTDSSTDAYATPVNSTEYKADEITSKANSK